MAKGLAIAGLGFLLIAGAGGVGVGLALMSPSSQPEVSLKPGTTAVASLCEFNALGKITESLDQIKAVNAIAHDPLPAIATLASQSQLDILAQFSPAPFPTISDRARQAKVPILMYHDITPTKDVDWDVTPQEFADQLAQIKAQGLSPISLDQLVNHLRTGANLPAKPILLTFDDNYLGQYKYAFPLLQQYNYPAVWSVHTAYVGNPNGKPKATWAQLQEMHQSGLITIASHTVNHFNLTQISPDKIDQELRQSKAEIEKNLGIKVRYFTYPEGSYDPSITPKVAAAGYEAALSMSLDPNIERPANQSEDLLSLMRYGVSRFEEAIAIADGGNSSFNLFASTPKVAVDFTQPVQLRKVTFNQIPLTLVHGGRPITVHADRRAAVEEIKQKTPAIAAVDGGFFSLESLDSNQMIGPVLSQVSSQAGIFNPGKTGENPLLKGRPLVLISPTNIRFVPYDPVKHNSLEQLKTELADVTDAFVGAGWLVRDGKPQSAASFGKLYGFDAHRDRAFWGIDRQGRPVIGVTMEMIDSVGLGEILVKAGLRDVVMLDSGASAALAYKGKSVMAYEPRPVPHIVALLPPDPKPIVATGNSPKLSCTR
ncbi:MAG: polysaccharide deacetylase family protein [Pseudanabaenaceae cyanobacterium bins.68]|nr:polysaccharide deacetylase family protein [Pseudanabaenaceae cyanobacterium bins.68]